MPNKRCTRCKQVKSVSAFGHHRCKPSGLRCECKICANKIAREHRSENPSIVRVRDRKYNLFHCFGLTPQQYEEMYELQKGRCAICGLSETAKDRKSGNTKRLSVDHCSTTRRVRSLLCGRCNVGIGYFRHSVPLLVAAIQYLEHHNPTIEKKLYAHIKS